MTISFSGLASGLDTSSWVESLVALKQAKVETLKEEKETVLLSQETLNNIKSFFSSFRNLIEKVTDAKFGVASMDLFAQNLANSSNLDVLTASATTEAEEATYNVLVDKLATETQAVSNYSYLTTIVQTTTATNDSKLTSLGVKAGNIGVNVNGVEHGITITENDTIATFIEKLQNIGVEASYNEQTGVFSMNIDDGAINDIDGTGIVDALHLEGVNEGYTSDHLQTSQTDTVYSAATEATLLSELGVNAGVITIHSNDRDYNITITNSSTLGSFIADLEANDIDAELDATGVFTISDAEITNEGTTDILTALGLAVDIYGKSQITGDLTHETVVTQTTTATSSTLLRDLGEGIAITDGQTVIVRDSNNEYNTITVGTTTTLGELLEEMSNAGLYAALKSDGTVEIAGGTITGGTFDAVEALGLEREPFTAMVTGDPLTETVEVHKLVDLQTRLVDDLKVTEGYLEVTDADGNKFYEKIYSGQTIADFMTDMGNLGIATSLDEETGILTITGGAFKTLTDTDVQALVNNGTIRESDSRYIHGTNLLECLYGSGTISTDHITVASTYSKTQALSHSVINTINATTTTSLGNLGLTGGTAIFDVRGESRTINVNSTMTIEDLMNELDNVGIASSWDAEHSKIMIENSTLTGGTSNLADVLNLTTTVSGKYVTSDELYSRETITIDATRDTVLADYGITNSMSTADRTVNLYNSDGTLADSMVVGEGTTIGNLLDWINGHADISASLDGGYLTINNGYIENATLEASMGLETSNKSSYVLGSVMTITTTAAVTGETTLGEIISTLGTTGDVAGGYNLNFNGHDLAVSADTTLNELIDMIYDNGGTAVLDNTGRLSINGGTLTGSVADALGIVSTTHTSSVSATGDTMYTTKEEYAELDTAFADLGINNSSYIIHDNLGNAITTINVAGTDTIGSFFDDLKANGIDATISNGVISLESADGRYITGALANALGLDTQTVTEVVNTTQSSTLSVTHTDTVLADITSTLGAIGAITGSGQNILIYDENQTVIGTISTLTTSSTVGDMFSALKEWGINATITNGVISFYSESGRYAAGTIMDNLGVTVENGLNETITIAETVTSGQISYTQNVVATEDTLISDVITLPADSNIIINDSKGNAIGTISVDNTTTFGELFDHMAEYGIDGDIHNGSIKLSPDSGQYATGAVLDLMGITLNQVVVTTTVGMTNSSSEVISYTNGVKATEDTVISDVIANFGSLGPSSGVYTSDNQFIEAVDVTSTMTFGELFAELSKYGIDADIHDGVIKLSPDNGQYVVGDVFDALGMTATETVVTKTVGMEMTSGSVVTYNKTITATGSSTIMDFATSGGVPDLYINGELVMFSPNVTFNELFSALASYGITASFWRDGEIWIEGKPGVTVEESGGGTFFKDNFDIDFTMVTETTTVTTTSGMTATSGTLRHTVIVQATEDSLVSDFINFIPGNETMHVYNSSGILIANSFAPFEMTFRDMFEFLSNADIDARFEDGRLVLTSENGNYVGGTVFSKLGISATATTTTSTTVGISMSSSSLTYTVYATGDSRIADFAGGELVPDLVINGQSVIGSGYMTFNELFSLLASYGVHANFASNGQIQLIGPAITVEDGGYFNTHFGLDFNNVTSTTTRVTTTVSSTLRTKEALHDTDFAWADNWLETTLHVFNGQGQSATPYIAIRNKNTGQELLLQFHNTQQTLGDVFTELAAYGIAYELTGDASNTYIQLSTAPGGDYYIYDQYLFGDLWDLIDEQTEVTTTVENRYDIEASNVISNTVAATMSTTLEELGVTSDGMIFLLNNGATSYRDFIMYRSSWTINDLLTALAGYGISGFIDNNNKLNLFSNDKYIVDTPLSGDVFDILGINIGEGGSYTVNTNTIITSTSNVIQNSQQENYTTSNTLGELGLTSNGTINVTYNDENYTITVNATNTIDDVLTALGGFGVSGSMLNGRITLQGTDTGYITAMSSNLQSALGITAGLGNTYQIVQETQSYSRIYTNSDTIQKTITQTMTTATTLDELIGDSDTIRVVSKGQLYTIDFDKTSTIDDILTTLAGFGIAGYVQDGRITLIGSEDSYIYNIGPGDLESKLDISYGEGNSYITSTETISQNTTSDELEYDVVTTLNTSSTFGDLGLSGTGTINVTYNGNNYTVTVTEDKTIDDILTTLAGLGISGSVAGGRLTLSGTKDGYITSMSANVQDALKLTAGANNTYTTSTDTIYENSTSNNMSYDDVRTMSTSTTLEELGLNSNQYITVVSNGTQHIVTVTSDMTVDDIISTLAGYGIAGSVIDGRITFTGGIDTYIHDMSQALKDTLKLTLGNGNSWTTEIGQTWVNSDSDEQTEVKDDILITGDTILSSINGYNNGDGRLVVHQTNGQFVTITVDGSSTVDEFFEQISRYGLVGTIGEDGKVTITGVGNVYLQAASGGTNILTALNLSNVVTNVQTITSNRTSDTLTHTVTVAASGTTSLGNLEDINGNAINFDASGNVSLVLETTSDAGNHHITLTFSRTQSLYDVIDVLAQYGIQASIDAAGRFSVTSSNLTDFDISGELGEFLMGNYTKEYGEDTTYNVSTNLVQETIVYMNDASKLADFGITGGNILVTQQGVNYTINIDPTTIQTIGDFRNLLAQYGFNSIIDSNGRLSVSGVGESYLSSIAGGSNILDILGLTDWTLGEITQSSDHLTDTEVLVNTISMSDRIADLTDAAGNNLGITDGQIYVYQDGTRSTINIDTNDTLETLAAKLSQYGITIGISQEGRLYFDGNNDSYLTTNGLSSANASNILSKLNIEGNWSTRYDSTSGKLQYEEEVVNVVDRSTKLSDLKDASGNDLNITEGTYYIYSNGVRNTETITADTTVNDFMATLAKYGLIADIAEDGSISVGAYNNTYLATSALAGQNSNVVSTLFAEWDFVNIYTSNGLDIPTDEIRAINRDTKLADINEGTYQAGYITVVKDGVQTNIELKADDTVGTLMDELALYGFESVINEDGQLIIKNSGDSLLQNYTGPDQASNALTLLGIGVNDWISTNTYKSDTLNVVQTSTLDASATRDTLLSELGVSTGEYYVYNNGVRYTALISSDETLGSFMDTLKSFGLETSLVQGPDGAVLSVVGKGDSYIAKSTSTTNASNVVDILFTNGVEKTSEYSGLQQTSELVTTFSDATLDTKLSYYDTPWGTGMLTAEGDLSVTVNGVESVIKISADETFGSLIEKFNALGLEATLANGELMIQSGYDTFTINTAGTTSSLLATIGLTYHDDLGGYVASTDTVRSTTTSIEERTVSVSNYADMSTRLGTLNISDGSLTVYRNGERATVQIQANDTFADLQSRLSAAFSDLRLEFQDGYLTFYSADGNSVEVGATTDTSNFAAITGITNEGTGTVRSARELYCVNTDSVITSSGLFRKGNVTEGTFIVGNATFNITSTTTLANLISQINSSDEANATAFWDNIDGKLVIKSRTTGSAFVNIEAGTSNFTDIMGYTSSEWAADGSLDVTRMNIATQEVGQNARVQINGTTYTSTSNTITSDVSRIKGLTINLKGLTEGTAVTLTVERDKETLANAISDVVDSYNELMQNVDEAIATDGSLHGETTLKLIRNQLRNMMTSSDAGTTIFRNLDSIGISVSDASASNISTTNEAIINLTFDKDKFIDAFEADQDAVKELLIGGANNKGIFTKVEELIESSLQAVTGYFASADSSYQREISRLDDKIAKANEDIERYRARLEAKFSAMDMLIAQMQQQYSTFLTT